MIDKRIGKRMKECRERPGLTQEQFAERLGLPPDDQKRILDMVELMIRQIAQGEMYYV